MLRPTDIEKIGSKESRYAIVVGVAKRARDIAFEAEENGVILLEKPVSMAIEDFAKGDYRIDVPEPEEEPDEEETAVDGTVEDGRKNEVGNSSGE